MSETPENGLRFCVCVHIHSANADCPACEGPAAVPVSEAPDKLCENCGRHDSEHGVVHDENGEAESVCLYPPSSPPADPDPAFRALVDAAVKTGGDAAHATGPSWCAPRTTLESEAIAAHSAVLAAHAKVVATVERIRGERDEARDEAVKWRDSYDRTRDERNELRTALMEAARIAGEPSVFVEDADAIRERKQRAAHIVALAPGGNR